MWGTLFPSAPSRADAKGKDVAHDEADEIPPVLTAGDLLHSLSYNAALSSHFRSLFPLLSSTKPGRIAEVVEREGGTYEGMRGRLEEEELRAEAMRGKGRRGWWTRLIGLQDSETEEEGGKGKQRERQERRDVHPLLRREVEEFWRTREGRSEVVPATTTSTSAIANPPNPDDECQCCFAPISPDPAHSVSCSPSPSSPSSASTDVHSFCHSCLAALIRTYTFDGAPIPDSLLTDGSIPCFAASSSPCPHRIPSSSLSHVLDPALRTALDRRTLETTVDRLAASGANLARCPFCPYAVMRDSTDSAGPISSVFVPAWVRTLPPTFWEVAKTAVGLVCLLGLVVVGCVVVLVFGGSAKLERAYDELYPSPSSPSILDDPDQRATPLLSLQTHLLLAPHHSPILILSHIRTLVSRILSVKFGRNTVFVCGASGAVARGGWDGGAREEGWLRRLEGVQEVQWDEDQEEEGEEGVVEERRRARLVEYLWPSEADEDGEGKREEGAWKSCGRLSCTLCFAALNPSAPSLHRCTSPSSTSSSAPSEQAQAEDSLRLAIEKAMSDAVTCRCGTAYCHLCHDAIPPSVGYTHFCQHPHDPHTGTCERGCGKCGLWTEPDERSRVESARRAAQRKWALDHPDWAEKVNLSSTSLKRVGPDLDVDSHPPAPHLTPLHSPAPTPPRTLSPARSLSSLHSLHSPTKASAMSLTPATDPRRDERAAEPGAREDEPIEVGEEMDDVPTTQLGGRLKVRVVEAKGLAIPEGEVAKPYVFLQYDRTDSVSREWGAPPPSAAPAGDGKRGAIRRKRPGSNSHVRGVETTVRRVVGGATTAPSVASTSPQSDDVSPVPSAFTSSRSTGTSSTSTSSAISSLAFVTLPPSPNPRQTTTSLPSTTHTLRPVSPSLPSGDPSQIGTPSNPIWNHTATFDVVSPGRTILVCVYDKLAPQGGDSRRIHGFLGASVFEPPLLEEVDKGEDGDGLDVWVPLTSALDPTIGGEIRLRLLFEPLLSRPKLTVDDFQILRRIGQGSFGQVFRVRKRDTKRIYAMKVIRKASITSAEALAQVLAERQVLARTIDSPFLVGLKFSFQSERELFLIQDYKSGGEMFQHLQRDGGRFEEAKVRFYVAEIILALEYLHENNIVYRDLKPENCLLDGSGHVVLCDFGLSKLLVSPDEKCRTLCGTTAFVAPEVLLDVGYSYPADWWSLGVLLFEMCFGWSPFYCESRIEEYERILGMEIKIPSRKGYGPELKDLLLKLLERDPEKRLGSTGDASSIKAHPFFSPIDWDKLALRQVSPPFKPPTHADDDQPDFYDNGHEWSWCFGDEGGCWQTPPSTSSGPGTGARNSRADCVNGWWSKSAAESARSSAAQLVRNFTWMGKEGREKKGGAGVRGRKAREEKEEEEKRGGTDTRRSSCEEQRGGSDTRRSSCA
ncbi:hypothetical protein JCM10296v2_003440 [Rhodotorula toruloides]